MIWERHLINYPEYCTFKSDNLSIRGMNLEGKMWHPIPWLQFSLQTHPQISKPIITHQSDTPVVPLYMAPGQYPLWGRV